MTAKGSAKGSDSVLKTFYEYLHIFSLVPARYLLVCNCVFLCNNFILILKG